MFVSPSESAQHKMNSISTSTFQLKYNAGDIILNFLVATSKKHVICVNDVIF